MIIFNLFGWPNKMTKNIVKTSQVIVTVDIIGWPKMVLEGQDRFWEHTKVKIILYIPADVYKDSQFPFKPKDQVKVIIDPEKKRMTVEKT